MPEESSVLQHYEAIARASSNMLHAARDRDWPALREAEREVAERIGNLKQLGSLPVMTPAERQRRLQLLRRILADDAEIRDLTEPWLKRLGDWMSHPDTPPEGLFRDGD